MKRIVAALLALCTFVSVASFAQTTRSHTLFDAGWKFYNGTLAADDKAAIDDSKWRSVTLPHDWSVEDVTTPQRDSVIGPFVKSSIGSTSTGYVLGGTAWYRKHFKPSDIAGKKVSIYFDGVYMNSDVWINNVHLGNHPYGYTPFSYDITPYIKPGVNNVISVEVKNEGRNSRWYSGSGIYRHVWLDVTNPVHVEMWGGVFITAPKVSVATATVNIKTAIANEAAIKGLTVKTQLIDEKGKVVAAKVSLVSANAAEQNIELARPALWWPEKPYLYQAITEVYNGTKLLDRVANTFGVRSIEFSAQKGFLLNGVKTLLKGGCIHHDNGFLGSAAIDRAEERKVELLKSAGYNAVRCSHNPPSIHFLDACDRLGLLVIDETFDQWQRAKNRNDYHLYFNDWWKKDVDAMMLRDRNHPSIIMWSYGNEINERADSIGLVIGKQLGDEIKRLDGTRPVTQAVNSFWDHRGYEWDRTAPAFALLDVGGYNYMLKLYEPDHAKYPNRIIVGTESFPKEMFDIWQKTEQLPYVIGDFVWTALDYLGETGVGHTDLDRNGPQLKPWPWFNAYCGDIDLIGGKKAPSYYRDVVWRERKIAMLVHNPIPEGHKEAVSGWGWPDEVLSWNYAGYEGKPFQVNVYTRYPSVKLLLNGKVIDQKEISDATKLTATFTVNYQAGELKAIAMQNGKAVDSVILKTTGKPAAIRLVADRKNIKASTNDLSYVTVQIVDEKGNVVPDAVLPVNFSLTGNATIAGVGNASPKDMQSFQKPTSRTFDGKCLAIIRPTGKAGAITLKAEAAGLTSGSIVITAK